MEPIGEKEEAPNEERGGQKNNLDIGAVLVEGRERRQERG